MSALSVLVVDDDPFSRAVVGDLLTARAYAVRTAADAREAFEVLEHDDVHVVVADLDLGDGPDGVTLLTRLAGEKPWIGRVVLSSHRAPAIAVARDEPLPNGTVYLVKGELTGGDALERAIRSAISVEGETAISATEATASACITASQAHVLRLLASGATVAQIAADRGTSRRAAERMLTRLYERLEVAGDPARDPKLAALRLWREGRVRLGV